MIDIIFKHFKIQAYHTRHNDTGYEMKISEIDSNKKPSDLDCVFAEITEQEYLEISKRQKEIDETIMWKRIVYQIPIIQLIKLLTEQKEFELLEFLKIHVDKNI